MSTSLEQDAPAVPPPTRERRHREPVARPRLLREPVQRAPLSTKRIAIAAVLFTLVGLLLWSLLFLTVVSRLSEARAQHKLYAQFRQELATATAPTGGDIAKGAPVALLTVPAAGIRGVVVVEGTSADVMRSGPGHLRTSPLPGQAGDSVIYGRSFTFGGPFGSISSLHAGDVITATTDQGVFHYNVTGSRHQGDPWTPPQNGQSGITLVSTQGGWTPSKVIFVDATLDGHTVPAPSGRPTTLDASERLLAPDHSPVAWIEVVLWLEVLVVVACVTTWLRTRWSGWQTWLVAVPTLFGTLWALSLAASRLLPNVF